jgi:fatty-acyl-CoA synthase
MVDDPTVRAPFMNFPFPILSWSANDTASVDGPSIRSPSEASSALLNLPTASRLLSQKGHGLRPPGWEMIMDEFPSDAAPSAYKYPLIIRQLLHTTSTYAGNQEIVYGDSVRYSYPTFLERLGRLASGLERLGVGQGNTVAVMDWDSHRYLECFFAVPMMGAVLHTVNIRLSPDQILFTINHADDDVILVHDDFIPVLEQIKDRIDRAVRLVRITDAGDAFETSLTFDNEYEKLVASGDEGYEFGDFDENTRATTFYTTGTTGSPKGVYFSHRQIVLHTLGFLTALGWSGGHAQFHRDDVYMPITPMFHVHAWGIPYLATLMGVKQVYPGRYLTETLLGLIARERVTFSHCVPTILHMLLSHPQAEALDLSGWKVIVGGSTMPKGLAKRAMELGVDVFTGYGMSETCPLLALSHLDGEHLLLDIDDQVELRCKAGRPSPLVELRVVDTEGVDVPWDGETTGEVVTRAPWLTQGYLKSPEQSKELWRGGYLHTGDIGTIDENGFIRLTDRLKDVIKSGGEWISSLELEHLVSQVAGVGEVAAIGVPDDKWGERPLVLVVVDPDRGVGLSDESIKTYLRGFADRGVISKWAVPDRVLLVDEIEKTSVGKIDKKVLREKYGSL